MSIPTGSPVLDKMLSGGLPEERTVLVTGGPGTGKTTLAMQFLQAGIDRGESCLFISTEQTPAELADSFGGFDFDLDADELTVTSLHATEGQTLEDDERTLTLQTLDGETLLGQDYSTPYEPKYLIEHLSAYAPVDRVVLDSVSGLSAMGSDFDVYRRTILDLVQLVNEEFGATAMFTAEESDSTTRSDDVQSIAPGDAVQYNTHGVIRVWREDVEGDLHRFLEVVKLRGVDHDTRVFEIEFADGGVTISPRRRTRPAGFAPGEYLRTGVPGLDELLGGGIVNGGSMLLEHDGQASPHELLTSLLEQAFEDGMSATLVPPVELPPKRFEGIFERRIGDMTSLMEDDRLFLIDYPNVWENTRRNVFKPTVDGETSTRDVFETIGERRGDADMFSAINIEAQLPVLSMDELRSVRFWEEENLYAEGDTSLYFFNPETMPSELAAFYRNGAWQVLRTWLSENGLQYVKLKKSTGGFVGSTRLVEYREETPRMRVQRPPNAGGDR